jgi:hypothetical protein
MNANLPRPGEAADLDRRIAILRREIAESERKRSGIAAAVANRRETLSKLVARRAMIDASGSGSVADE